MHASDDVCTLLMPLTTGAAQVSRNGRKLFHGALRPGMLRLTVPEERTQVVFTSATSLIELVVPSDSLRRAFREAGYVWPAGSPQFRPLTQPNRSIAVLASAFRLAPHPGSAQRGSYLDGLTQSLLSCLVDSQHFHVDLDRRSSIKPLDEAMFARCVDFAVGRLGGKLTLDAWAAELGMDVGEFARAFRKRTRQSPYAWFLERRIDYAKQLLAGSTSSLADIAYSAGFSSQSHFTETFRRRVGCTPARWLLQRQVSLD